jgi:hypothetical protein
VLANIRTAILVLGSALHSIQSQANERVSVISCNEYYGEATPIGTVFNNVWNKQAAANLPWSQCLLKREFGNAVQWGWRWNWPMHNSFVYAQPQIKVGLSPWDPRPQADTRLPRRISALQRFSMAYDIDSHSTGNFNTATTLWLTKDRVVENQPNPTTITAELMIWHYFTPNQSRPGGKRTDTIETGGKRWEVWLETQWKDVSGHNKNQWTYLTFRATQPAHNGSVDILSLIQYSVAKGYISKEHFVSNLDFGNELMGGVGETWIKQFQVELK